jgi:endonuclease/exonuclease/phosphatase family metal-dependent hydrolase
VPQLRIATYNVHGCVGLDGRHDPSRPLQVLRRLGADLVALQEFVNEPTPQGVPLLEHWRESLGMHGCFVPAFTRARREFGNAVLSRMPIERIVEHDISAPGGRRRVALEVRVSAGARSVRVLCVHCAVRARPRSAQYAMLADLVREPGADVAVLLGDFNEWRTWNPRFRELADHFAVGPPLPTFPAVAPAIALDRIWVRPSGLLLATHVDRERPAPYASDHLPVVATVTVD